MGPLRSVRPGYYELVDQQPQIDMSHYESFKKLYDAGTKTSEGISMELGIDRFLASKYIVMYRKEKERAFLNKPPRFEMS